jgi:hypothetical protein
MQVTVTVLVGPAALTLSLLTQSFKSRSTVNFKLIKPPPSWCYLHGAIMYALKNNHAVVFHKNPRLVVTLDAIVLHVNTPTRMDFNAGQTVVEEAAAVE